MFIFFKRCALGFSITKIWEFLQISKPGQRVSFSLLTPYNIPKNVKAIYHKRRETIAGTEQSQLTCKVMGIQGTQ